MWPRNDGTFITPHGQSTPVQEDRQAIEIAYLTALSRGMELNGMDPIAAQDILKNYAQNVKFNTPNGPHNPEDELDVTDSEFENDSEFDSELDDSEQENEAVVNNKFQQNPHNNYIAPSTLNMQNVSVNDSNYSVVNPLTALTQLSSLAAPNFSVPNQNVSSANHSAIVNALSQQSTPAAHWKPAQSNSQGNHVQQTALTQLSSLAAPNFSVLSQNVSSANHSAIVNALSQQSTPTAHWKPAQSNSQGNHVQQTALTQLSSLAAPNFSVPSQSVSSANHSAIVNALSQQSTPAAHWKPAQSNGQGNHVQQNHDYKNTGFNNGGVNPCDQNGNDDGADDKAKQKNNAVKNRYKLHSTNPTVVARECNLIRPRVQRQRREAGAYLYQIQSRELEESFTSIESASPSRIKDMTASLKRLKLPRSHFSRISQFFQRNKTPSHNNLINTLPELRDSITLPFSPQSNEELDGMDELEKIKTSDELPPENESIWTSSEHQTDLRSTLSDDEKSIQALHFRSNFPYHFLGIRLLRLGIGDVQQIIQQVDLLENVREKLTETVAAESLSGPALMSCDLIELKKSLDLNLGNWTIFEQLITGLRRIQNNELLKLGIQKQTKIDEGLANNGVQIIDTNLIKVNPNNTQTLNGRTCPANHSTPS